MKIQLIFTVLAFITKIYCYHKPILRCGLTKYSKKICASNGRTYRSKCDFQHDKLLVHQNLYILHFGKCHERKIKKKHRYVEEELPPQVIIEDNDDDESSEYIIEESYETEKPWTGIIQDIVKKKIDVGKRVVHGFRDTLDYLFNYDTNKRKKKIIYKKKGKKHCFYCP